MYDILYNQNKVTKKKVILHPSMLSEFKKLDNEVKDLFLVRFEVLEKIGFLREPEGKKIQGTKNLFEMRVRSGGQWRAFYGYILNECIAVVLITHKKTKKTDPQDIKLTLKRIKDYE